MLVTKIRYIQRVLLTIFLARAIPRKVKAEEKMLSSPPHFFCSLRYSSQIQESKVRQVLFSLGVFPFLPASENCRRRRSRRRRELHAQVIFFSHLCASMNGEGRKGEGKGVEGERKCRCKTFPRYPGDKVTI